MKTDNELIAEFMGITEVTQFFDSYGIKKPIYWSQNDYFRTRTYDLPNISLKEFIQESKYDKSWDWLMPVVEKISNMNKNDVTLKLFHNSSGRVFKECLIDSYKGVTRAYNDQSDNWIENVYRSVIEFIKWHNSVTTKQ